MASLRDQDLPLLDTFERDRVTGERLEKERDTYFDETCTHLCQYLDMNLETNEDPLMKLAKEAELQQEEMEKARQQLMVRKQAYKDLEKEHAELKTKYRELVEERATLEKNEAIKNSKAFSKMSFILNATYKTNDDGKTIAGNVLINSI